MSTSGLVMANAVALAATMSAYALFSGADFGGGIWDLLAGGTERGRRPRAEIDASVTPVWEGNHTWIVLGLVIVWTVFPPVFSAVMTALFVPLALSLLGLVLRGVGFAFRHESERQRVKQLNGVLFAGSSLLVPFFLGASVGAVATGEVPANPTGNVPSAWTSPAALLTGVLFVSTCAYIGAVYLVADAKRRGHADMVTYFSRRAMAAGVVTGALAAANLVLLHFTARRLADRLLGPALPLVIVSGLAGLAALALIVVKRTNLLRVTAGLAVVGVVGAWAWAQYPYILPWSLTLAEGSAPGGAQWAEVAVFVMAALFVVPGFVWLYWLQQREKLTMTESSPELRQAVAAQNQAEQAGQRDAGSPGRSHPLLVGAVLATAAVELARDLVSRRPGGSLRR